MILALMSFHNKYIFPVYSQFQVGLGVKLLTLCPTSDSENMTNPEKSCWIMHSGRSIRVCLPSCRSPRRYYSPIKKSRVPMDHHSQSSGLESLYSRTDNQIFFFINAILILVTTVLPVQKESKTAYVMPQQSCFCPASFLIHNSS